MKIYQSKLYKACFQYDMVYGDSKDLPRRMASDKVLCNTVFDIAENPKYDGCQQDLASMIYNIFH